MRKPSLHRIHGLSNRIGLTTLLRGTAGLAEVVQTVAPNLSILTTGPLPANPNELLHLGLAGVAEELQGRYDFVLIDCPPLLGFGDSVGIASLAGSVLLVANAGVTQQAHLASSLRQLRSVRAHLLGVVLNRIRKDLGAEYGYYNSYYYQEGRAESSDEAFEPVRRP